jgi:hypothetical protein
MYAMVNSASNLYNSLNQVYMAGLMRIPAIQLPACKEARA